jgi:hypothetical protein
MVEADRALLFSPRTVTEDYSSYESVTDGEEVDEQPAKIKVKDKNKAPRADETGNKKLKQDESPAESVVMNGKTANKAQSSATAKTAATKGTKMGGSSKGDIKNFFAKK